MTIARNATHAQFLKSKTNVCTPASQSYYYQGWLMGRPLWGSAQKKEGGKIVAGHIYLSIVEQLILLKSEHHILPPTAPFHTHTETETAKPPRRRKRALSGSRLELPSKPKPPPNSQTTTENDSSPWLQPKQTEENGGEIPKPPEA